ncbi:MAG: hypothetical protein ACI9R8_000771 [Candidatus Paceibacteria bacterium]|jgi:hypothetical protein
MNVSMKIPPITPAIAPERSLPASAQAQATTPVPTAASSNLQPAASVSLLAQVTTAQSASAAAEVRLFRTGETLQLESKVPLQAGQIISVKAAGGGYQIDQSGQRINQYLLRLLLPRDAALQRPIAEMQRWQGAAPAPGISGTGTTLPGTAAQPSHATTLSQQILTTGLNVSSMPTESAATTAQRLIAGLSLNNPGSASTNSPAAAPINAPGAAQLNRLGVVSPNNPGAMVSSNPATGSHFSTGQPQRDLAMGPIRLANTTTMSNNTAPSITTNAAVNATPAGTKTATPNPATSAAPDQRPPVPEAAMTLVRTLISNLPQRGQLDATAIRDFIRLASLLPATRDPATGQPTSEERTTNATSTASLNPATAARPGLLTLLLQIARALTPGDALAAGAVTGDRALSGTQLRKPVADMLSKLLLNQLQPLMHRGDATDSEMRRVDLLVRNDQQLDSFNLQFSRVDLPATRMKEDDADAPNQANGEKTRAWRVKLTFDLQRLGEVSAIINYTEGKTLSTSIWSNSADTFALLHEHQSQLQERLATSLQNSGIDILIDVYQGTPSHTPGNLSSHLVDTRA